MTSHHLWNYLWGTATTVRWHIATRESAPKDWGLPTPIPGIPCHGVVGESHALGLFNAEDAGLILEGSPRDILTFVDRLHADVHRELGGAGEPEERACDNCGDRVSMLSSRDWCDGCEGITIPAEVWTAFLAQESELDRKHGGDVTLSAVVDQLLRLMYAHPDDDEGSVSGCG